MDVNRRDFIAQTAALAATVGSTSAAGVDRGAEAAATRSLSEARAEFPWATRQTYLDSAALHPVGSHAARVVERCLDYRVQGPGSDRLAVGERELQEVKRLYANLINATPNEIAFVQSTTAGENIVAAGLGLGRTGGNIVTDELHFHGGLYLYQSLEQAGLEVRVVKQRDWRIDVADMDAAIDRDTRLVAVTLVSNINGFLHDIRAVSDVAHARGTYVYADVIQAVGCLPVDVRAMGIDFCAAATYKWLMGLKGLGFLYVREDLQDTVVPTSQFGGRHYANLRYHNFPGSPPGAADRTWDPRPGAARYEVGTLPSIAAACQLESLRYIAELGVANIAAHVKPLTDRVREEVPKLGYPTITPPETPTPIVSFLVQRPEEVKAKLVDANVAAKVLWNQLRVSPSVFNTQQDVDRLLGALA